MITIVAAYTINPEHVTDWGPDPAPRPCIPHFECSAIPGRLEFVVDDEEKEQP